MIFALISGAVLSLWNKFMGWIIGAGVIIVAVGMVFLKGRAEGKRVYREAHEKQEREATERSAEIIKKIQQATPDEVNKKLEKYYRD